jgi:hypothetical protein
MELAARRFVANPAGARDEAAMLRRQFQTWAANDALFQPIAENNKLLTEVIPLSKDLSALGEAGLKLLDYLAPSETAQAALDKNKKTSRKKPSKKELAAQEAAKAAKAEWLAKENAELDRLSRPARRAAGEPPQTFPGDVRLAAYRPIKVLADGLRP